VRTIAAHSVVDFSHSQAGVEASQRVRVPVAGRAVRLARRGPRRGFAAIVYGEDFDEIAG